MMTDLVANNIAAWTATAAFLCLFLVNALKLADRAKGKPTPQEVQSEAQRTYATQSELKELEKKLDLQREHGDESRRVLHNKIDAMKSLMHDMELRLVKMQGEMEERISTKTSSDVGAVHDRVNAVLSALSEMRGEIKNMHTRAERKG